MARIFVSKETHPGERRVAATPETVSKYLKSGHAVSVEKGAGEGARIPDEAFRDAGATLATAAGANEADIVLRVRRPSVAETRKLAKDAVVVAIMDPFPGGEGDAAADLAALRDGGATAFALDLAPRTTRAQAIDVLSSQANLAGYQAVIDAAAAFDRALPLMMTAAGTVPAAKVFVMGAGVAGLQAIATARRLGAVVTATDVRAAAGEQVESLGAKFVMTDALKDASGTGGYARELSAEETAAQNELVSGHIAKQDIVVTTALIPGRPAPRLVSRAMLASMKPGSVVVDLALERGGNVEGVQEGETVMDGVTVIAHRNVASRLAASASNLYARNVEAFVRLIVGEDGAVRIDTDDDIVAAALVTRSGTVPNETLAATLPAAGGAKKAPTRKASTGKKAPARKASAKTTSAEKTPARKTPAKKTDATEAPLRKTPARKTSANKEPS